MNRDQIAVTFIWIIFSVILEVLLFVFKESFFIVQGAEQALIIDEAFFLLMVLSIPIFTFMVSIIGYSIIKFSNKDDSPTDAKPVFFHKKWAWSWLIWSTALCLFVIVTPGFTGLNDLRATSNQQPDLLIEATASRWLWEYNYIDQTTKEPIVTLKRSSAELVLPNESLIRFKITAKENDVLHSFWIPAFRQKIDAVPGLITTVDISTNRLGSFDEDVNYRLQCAELCGLGHATMMTKVRVIDKEEFKKWITENRN